jgi:hypothetical protein
MNDKDPLLKIAKTILIFCFIISLLGIGSEMLDPKDDIFEKLNDMIQPIITLIIGYLFGKKDQ